MFGIFRSASGSLNMQAKLPEEKKDRIRNLLTQFLQTKSVTKCELSSLQGHLNFACCVNVTGRSFVSFLLQVSMFIRELHHHIHISREHKKDLQMWSGFLNQWNGISLFYDDSISASADIEPRTDASDMLLLGLLYGSLVCKFIPRWAMSFSFLWIVSHSGGSSGSERKYSSTVTMRPQLQNTKKADLRVLTLWN